MIKETQLSATGRALVRAEMERRCMDHYIQHGDPITSYALCQATGLATEGYSAVASLTQHGSLRIEQADGDGWVPNRIAMRLELYHLRRKTNAPIWRDVDAGTVRCQLGLR